jgi:ubiquinone/menaquinone biosynthesis C-methylase UbiE
MEEPGDAHAVWEEHYSATPQVWSGRVNARLADVAPTLDGSRVLDLGCGEGADAIWLAEHGWTVVAVDVSTTALTRAREAATSRGVADRIDFVESDLTRELPQGPFDLVSAQFLHSTVAMDRSAVLRRAAAAVAPGGTLLIVDHAAAPPWASRLHHHEFPTAESVLDGLALDGAQWQRIRVERVERSARGPGGEAATLVDNVIVVRRTAGVLHPAVGIR